MELRKNPKFDLKLKYQKTFEISLVVSLVFLIAAFKFFPPIQKSVVNIEKPQELIKMEDVEITRQNELPPPPPKPPIPIEAPSDDVLDDIEIQTTELDVDAVIDAPPPPVEDDEDEVTFEYFAVVEQLPEPIGGMQSIHQRINYPEIARRAGIQGKVYVKAFVDENGDVQKVEVLKGIGAGCDEEIVRVVKETKFQPGKQRGKPVRVQVAMSFLFTLEDQ